jgi:cytochrome subunit of sulfide dehydrogenase
MAAAPGPPPFCRYGESVKALVVALLCLSAIPASAQSMAPPGASACSGCHGRGGASAVMGAVHGREPGEIVVAMQAFRAGERPATVMDRIAKGFSDDEIRAIAAWLAAQK